MQVDEAAEEGMEDAANMMLADAQRHVPYDDGVLMASADVDTEKHRVGLVAASIEAAVSYDTEYAVKLHEHPEFNFQGQGEGKWLERAQQRAEIAWMVPLAKKLVAVFMRP